LLKSYLTVRGVRVYDSLMEITADATPARYSNVQIVANHSTAFYHGLTDSEVALIKRDYLDYRDQNVRIEVSVHPTGCLETVWCRYLNLGYWHV
jgi:hypothetical protein